MRGNLSKRGGGFPHIHINALFRKQHIYLTLSQKVFCEIGLVTTTATQFDVFYQKWSTYKKVKF